MVYGRWGGVCVEDKLSCSFLIVLCLSSICLFRCPFVLNMVVIWQLLQGCSLIGFNCCVASL